VEGRRKESKCTKQAGKRMRMIGTIDGDVRSTSGNIEDAYSE